MANNWTNSQRQAIETSGSNILVSAAAGSGKTAVLVERIIRKITAPENPVSVDRLVVVTFTKAAAAEMRQRIRLELDRLIEQNPSDQNLIRQQTLVNNAKITTIDSFCLDIVRNYFTETDIDPGFRTADEGEIRLVENDVINELLEDYYTAADAEFVEFVEAYGAGRDDSRIVDIILKIYRFARSYPWENEWYDKCLEMYGVSDKKLKKSDITERGGKSENDLHDGKILEQNPCVQLLWGNVRKALTGYISKYEKYLSVCNSPDGPVEYTENIGQELMALERTVDAESFEKFLECVKSFDFGRLKSCRSKPDEKKKAFVQDGRNDCKDYVKSLQKMFSKSAAGMISDIEINARAVGCMVKLARDFSQRMQAQKRERNIIDFNDMEHLALDILVKNDGGKLTYSAVADSLSDFYEEILIDEYQDSNMLQEQILTAVSKSRREDCADNIYMVGDVKQSIYRFRMACPELFMEKSRKYVALEDLEKNAATGMNKGVRIQLQNNFRSRDNILASTNCVFEKIMTDEYGGIPYDADAKLYHGADYAKSPDFIVRGDTQLHAVPFSDDAATEIHLFEKGTTDLSTAEAEAQVIGDIIRNLMSTDEGNVHVVADKNAAGGYRPLKYSDIVIISRTIKDFAQIVVNSLMNQGIPAYTENSKGFFQVHEIQLILSFLNVVDNPQNDIPMAAVMMSFFGRFTSKDMAHIRDIEKNTKLYNILRKISDIKTGEAEVENDEAAEKIKKIDGELVKKTDELLLLIENYREKSDVMSVYDLLWEALYSTGFYDYVGTMPSGERRQANLDILLQKAGDFEKTSYRGLFNFLRYVERLQTYDVELGEASVLSEKDDIVRVMSIHKSKGLEFPVVIVAGMGKRMDHKDAAGAVVTHQTYGIGADVVRLDTRTKNPTVIKNAIAMALREEDTSEFMRILYVAMTRAKEKLIMTGHVGSKLENAMAKWESRKDRLLESEGKSVSSEEEIEKIGHTYDYAEIDGCTNFLDMVMPVAMISEAKNDNVFSITIHDEIEETMSDLFNNLDDNEKVKPVEVPEYPYELKERIKSKVTVSELKEQLADEDFEESEMLLDSVKAAADEAEADEKDSIVPKFLSSETEILKGNQRGSAYHRIMECLNYSKFDGCKDKSSYLEQVGTQLDEMLESRRITAQQHDCIDCGDIVQFIKSDTGVRTMAAAKAGKLRREQPFVYIDERIKEQLVQGVIDMYFVEDGELVIVDYKTDRVAKKDGADVLVKRYGVQLDYYAKALCQITGLPVKEKIIYSFALGRGISVGGAF